VSSASARHSVHPSQTAPNARPLEVDLIQSHGQRLARHEVGLEQLALRAAARDLPGQGLRLRPALRVEFAEVRDGFLNDLAAPPDRAHEAPVRVRLLPPSPHRVPQVHRRRSRPAHSRQNTKASARGTRRHYIALRPLDDENPRRYGATAAKLIFPGAELRKFG